ncbi:MAG TPA: hypothetical protein VMU80_09330 [Bryobacteraceae bacterium]|nr:hypothetical protein [Bryobacteraceae bacterium]
MHRSFFLSGRSFYRLALSFLVAVPGSAILRAQYRPLADISGDLGQKAIHRLTAQGRFALNVFVPSIHFSAISTDNWLGGTGNWNTATSWSLGALPSATTNAAIGNSTPAAVVQLNVSGTVDNLTIGTSSTLNFANGGVLAIAGNTITNSNSTGSGGIVLNSTGSATELIVGSFGVTLTGGGTVTLSNSGSNYIFGAAGTDVLTNVDNTIQGSGKIGNGQMGLVNGGTIDANQSTSLTIHTSSGTTNTGTLEATNGGNLILYGDSYTNTGGTILASGTNSIVTLLGSTINGGTLNTDGGGLIEASGGPVLNGVVNDGTYRLLDGTSTTLEGAITNSGAMQVNSAGSVTTLWISGNTTLAGNGVLALSNNANNLVEGVAGTEVLTNSNTIEGSGNLGNNLLGIVNNGTIVANQSVELFVRPNSSGITNNGIVQVDSGSTLDITGGPFTNFNSATGTLTGGTYNVGGTLQFDGANIVTNAASITLAGSGAKILSDTGANALANFAVNAAGGSFTVSSGGTFTTAGALTNSGVLDLETGGKLTISGGLTNNGTVLTNGTNQQGAANRLTVTGTLTNNSGASFTVGANNNTSDTASLGLLSNAGTVTVDSGASLTLTQGGTDTNNGAISVSGSLTLDHTTGLSGSGIIMLNGGGITGAGPGQAVTNATTIEGAGTISNVGLTNRNAIMANQAAPLVILPDSAGLNNQGVLTVAAGSTMQIGTSAGGALTNLSGTTLSGGIYNVSGTLQFGSSIAAIATNAAKISLNGTGARMINFGGGNLLAGFNVNSAAGNFSLINGASLTTAGGSFLNAGTFSVASGSIFTVGGSSFNFTQTAGSTIVNGTLTSTSLGTLDVNGGTLSGAGTLGYNVVDAGTLDPGASATKTGRLTVSDSYTQSATGALNIAIGGTAAGSTYDQLKVTQSATLGGTLNVTLANGFTPSVGQTFTIVTASAVSDTFSAVNGLAINSSEHFAISYSGNNVVLTVVSGALSGSQPSLVSRAVAGRERYHAADFRPHAAGFLQAPAVRPVFYAQRGPVMRGFRPMDEVAGVPIAATPAVAASLTAAAYNSMASMNHLRFECGVDLLAALKLRRKQLLKGLWATPDSPAAIDVGYVAYTGAR